MILIWVFYFDTKLNIYLDKENEQYSNGTVTNSKAHTQISKPCDDGEAQPIASKA